MAICLTTEEVMTIRVLSKKGMPQRQIARELGVTEGAVRYHIRRGASGAKDGRANKSKKAGELAAEIEAWRAAHADAARPINIKELYEHLEAEHGYTGSYKSVVRWVRSHWPKPKIRTYRRVETPPGAQTQTDWGHFRPLVFGQEEFAPMAFVMSLSHSRKTAVIWSRSRDQVHWLRCHNEAFLRLGGIPATNRVDNEKTAVCHGAGSWGRITPAYQAYADSMRFHVDACQPRQPQAKGKVENKVRLSRTLGPKRKAYDALEELQEETDASFERWAKKTLCPVTGRLVWDTWLEELRFLQPLPEALPEPFDKVVWREVHRDCLVNFEGRQYAVPFKKVGLAVEVRGCADKVQIYHAGELLIEYPRGTEARLLIDPSCFCGESDDRVVAPQPLGKLGRQLEEIYSMPVEQRPLDQYAALAEACR
jgi:transposase